MLGYAPTAELSDESMRVLITHMGLVMIWVAAPAAREAAKKSVGVRRAVAAAVFLGSGPSLCPWFCCLRRAMARSARDLKKKNEAQLVALPRRLGVRPR